jgi:hypothetical protein
MTLPNFAFFAFFAVYHAPARLRRTPGWSGLRMNDLAVSATWIIFTARPFLKVQMWATAPLSLLNPGS